MTMTKTCITCKEQKPATLEYFYHNAKNKDRLKNQCKVCSRKYALDRLNSMTPEYRKAMKKAEVKRNQQTYRQQVRKYIAIKRGVAHENWTENQLIQTYGSDCYICNNAIDFNAPRRGKGSEYSFWPDHVIPTSRGGSNTIANVRPCHRTCNEHKGRKTYEEYIKFLKESAQ